MIHIELRQAQVRIEAGVDPVLVRILLANGQLDVGSGSKTCR